MLALIGLFAAVNGSKWFFDGKRLPTLVLRTSTGKWHLSMAYISVLPKFLATLYVLKSLAYEQKTN